jgi:hypothetical protein
MMRTLGETDAGAAGEQPARDSRADENRRRGSADACVRGTLFGADGFCCHASENSFGSPLPLARSSVLATAPAIHDDLLTITSRHMIS